MSILAFRTAASFLLVGTFVVDAAFAQAAKTVVILIPSTTKTLHTGADFKILLTTDCADAECSKLQDVTYAIECTAQGDVFDPQAYGVWSEETRQITFGCDGTSRFTLTVPSAAPSHPSFVLVKPASYNTGYKFLYVFTAQPAPAKQ